MRFSQVAWSPPVQLQCGALRARAHAWAGARAARSRASVVWAARVAWQCALHVRDVVLTALALRKRQRECCSGDVCRRMHMILHGSLTAQALRCVAQGRVYRCSLGGAGFGSPPLAQRPSRCMERILLQRARLGRASVHPQDQIQGAWPVPTAVSAGLTSVLGPMQQQHNKSSPLFMGSGFSM